MNYCLLVWSAVFWLFTTHTHAAVRSVGASERAITPIYLSLGRSTVLRFREKPKRVVLGNRNYFNIEFIENDLAIQPLGVVTTNLFVYGEAHTYGFSLHSNAGGGADDLVHVGWAPPEEFRQMIQSREVQGRALSKQAALGKNLQIRLKRLSTLKSRNLAWLEVSILSQLKESIDVKSIDVKVFGIPGKELPSHLVCEENSLKAPKESACRIFFPLTSHRERMLKAKWKDHSSQVSF